MLLLLDAKVEISVPSFEIRGDQKIVVSWSGWDDV